MTDQIPVVHNHKRSSGRRTAMLASVGALGIAVALGGPGVYRELTSGSAYAAETTPAAQPSGFADVVARVKPAVISVRVKLDGMQPSSFDDDDMPFNQMPFSRGWPMEKFFRRFGLPDIPQKYRNMTGQGSGFFISADGYAVTNNHVIDHAKSVQVTTDDGRTYAAKVIGSDSKSDLALIKVDGRDDFPFVKFADKPPRVGDWVIAVGNPFGLSETVTAGIVSARARDIGAGSYDDLIQIDAPINTGNSGGPSFDIEGNVVGVNTAIFSPSGGSVGIGFAVPADSARMIVAQLKDSGAVTRGWLGVQIQQITPEIADSLDLKATAGALVAKPEPESPATKAGVKSGDVITAVNGQEIKSFHELARRIGAMAPNSKADLTILRDGTQKTVAVTLGTMPNTHQARVGGQDQEQTAADLPHFGLTLAPAGSVAGAGSEGVVVTAVEPEGPAAEQGFQTGDVILNVGGKSVSTPSDVRKALHDAKAGGKHSVLMRVKSGEEARFVTLPIDRSQG
jgi:serine protease Do